VFDLGCETTTKGQKISCRREGEMEISRSDFNGSFLRGSIE
jgi:hypothetical protein